MVYVDYLHNIIRRRVSPMANEKNGNTSMLILSLLSEEDKYGYQMIEELEKRSNNIFTLKTGTLYPLLHTLEEDGCITSYEMSGDNKKMRKYYSITKQGIKKLSKMKAEWSVYSETINIMIRGVRYAN